MSSRVRAFCFTINNYDEYDLGDCLQLYDTSDARYMILGFETAPTTLTPHIQAYIYFANPKRCTWLSKQIPRASIRIANGTPQQNHKYIVLGEKNKERIEEEIMAVEFGEIPHQGQSSFDRVAEVMNDPRINPHMFMQYRKSWIDMQSALPQDKRDREVKYIDVEQRYNLHDYFQNMLKFSVCVNFEDYNGEQVVFIDPSDVKDRIIQDWSHNCPTKKRIGFQFVRFDPLEVIVVIDGDITDYPIYIKKLSEYKSSYIIDNADSSTEDV